ATRHINDIEVVLSHVMGFKIWKSSVYMFTTIPNEVDWSAVGWITLTGITLAGLGALAPAMRAARLLPAETLRCE
ncbi:MAG: lipoprotein-releasing system transmembrane subunit, LolC/LolE family, partial [Planctomycetes bacterium]|nr:lipoprotein-releasing system transmembrane subunit, LolC/LolE family [Planctomycetota bacterium]